MFAPGHLGELTGVVPFELVDAVLAETKRVQHRVRLLPSRVGVYLVLAMGLFEQAGLVAVWGKLMAALTQVAPLSPSEKALRDLRRRVGAAPFKALFEVLSGPLAQPGTPGVCYRRWRTVAFDGCSSIKVPDHARVRAVFEKVQHRVGWAGYPLIRVVALVETGTRAMIGARFGPADLGECAYAAALLPLLSAQMLVLDDRGFDSDDFLAMLAGTGAQFLVRAKGTRRPPVLALLPDGSYLTRIGALRLRVIQARITVTGTHGGAHEGHYLLLTTLLDHRTDPAGHLVALYHERWEIESGFYALRHTLLGGRVLRSSDPAGIEQEMWALLTLYQVLRTVMVTAAESAPGTDPDRVSFTLAVQSARDSVVQADNVVSDGSDPLGRIGRTLLSALLPARRPRYSARKVKSPISRFHKPDPTRPAASTPITAITTVIRPPDHSNQPGGRWPAVLAVMHTDPDRPWTTREIIAALDHPVNINGFQSQMMYWHTKGFLNKTGPGTYTLIHAPHTALTPHQKP